MLCDLTKIPEHIRYGMFRYVEYGNVPGNWMCYLLSNDLIRSWGFADTTNREAMGDLVNFLYNDIPSPCKGSEKAIEAWNEAGGAKGQDIPIEYKGHYPDWFDKEDRE